MKEAKRVIVVGGRRKRQGTGPFVTRAFAKAGANICGIVGTSRQTVELARQELKDRFDIRCQGYESLDQAVKAEKPEILAVCTPSDVHLEILEKTAAFGIHCLCEKPLWWENSHPNRLEKTSSLLNTFRKNQYYLQTITQWPYTLDYFFKLFPGEKNEPVRKFEMELSPRDEKKDMIPDSVPHLLSMLYALVGYGRVESPGVRILNHEKRHWEISFIYRTPQTRVETALHLIPVEKPPRPAAFAINGKKVHRKIRSPGYSFYFEANGNSLSIPDPLDLLVVSFLEKVYCQEPLDYDRLLCGMEGLDALDTTVQQEINNLLA